MNTNEDILYSYSPQKSEENISKYVINNNINHSNIQNKKCLSENEIDKIQIENPNNSKNITNKNTQKSINLNNDKSNIRNFPCHTEVNMSNDSSFFYNKNSLNLDILNTNKKDSLMKKKINSENRKNVFKNKIFYDRDNSYNGIKSFKSIMSKTKGIKSLLQSQLINSNNKTEKNISYGERLFQRGNFGLEKKEKKIDDYRRQKQKEFEKNCTFKPQLNPNSLSINLKSNLTRIFNTEQSKYIDTENLNERSIKEIRQSNSAINMKRKNNQSDYYINKTEGDTINTLDFSKKINKTIFKTEEEIEHISKRLYSRAEIYKNRKVMQRDNFYNQTCTFSPDIIRKNNEEIPSMNNFFNRLQNWVDKRNDKYEIDMEKIKYDEQTGKRLFSPQINNKTKFINVKKNINSNKFFIFTS
jgi:hypothetical protein